MTLNETMSLTLAWVVGGALGALFFGGLWWTVRKALASRQPAFWFLGSLLLRMSIVLAGFYSVLDHQWERALSCLLGFVMARWAVMRLTRDFETRHFATCDIEKGSSAENRPNPFPEASHAN